MSTLLQNIAITAVIFDFFMTAFSCYISIEFVFNINESDFQPSYFSMSDEDTRIQVGQNYVLITLPLNLLLFYKLAMGIRWIIKRFKRPAM